MIKLLSLVTCLIMATFSSFGQEKTSAFEKNSHLFTIGYGAGNFSQDYLRNNVSAANKSNSSFIAVGPLFGKYEIAIEDKLGFGVNFAYMKNTLKFKDENSLNQEYNAELTCETMSFLARVNYHIGHNERIDPYVGLGVGVRNLKWLYDDDDPSGNTEQNGENLDYLNFSGHFPVGFDLTFGMRFYPTSFMGIYIETGIAKGVIQGGLSFKI